MRNIKNIYGITVETFENGEVYVTIKRHGIRTDVTYWQVSEASANRALRASIKLLAGAREYNRFWGNGS